MLVSSIQMVQVPMEGQMEHVLSKAGILGHLVSESWDLLWCLSIVESLKAQTDLSSSMDSKSIEKKIPCLMNRDKIVEDLQGYRCWAVGWGKTSSDGIGDYSNQVIWCVGAFFVWDNFTYPF